MTASSRITKITQLAKEQLAKLTGFEPGTVSALTRQDGGWQVTIDFVELKRIPNTTDVLATYEASLDEEGNLVSYRRTHRYFRDQVAEMGT